MKSTPFFAGIGLAALLSSCSVYHSAPIDLNAEEASWKEASSVDSPTSITQNQARQIGLVMNPDLNKARLKLASSNEVARQSGWWNDPSFSWDIEQVLQENTVNMSGSLGFTIPVTGLPALEKKVAEQYKEADFWTLRQAELDFLSSLDQAWSKLAVTQRRKTVIRERLNAIRRENGMIEQLIGAGEVDFSSRQVASQRMNDAIRELQTVTETELEQKMELVKLMGLHPSAVRKLGFLTETKFPASRRRTGSRPFSLDRLSKNQGTTGDLRHHGDIIQNGNPPAVPGTGARPLLHPRRRRKGSRRRNRVQSSPLEPQSQGHCGSPRHTGLVQTGNHPALENGIIQRPPA